MAQQGQAAAAPSCLSLCPPLSSVGKGELTPSMVDLYQHKCRLLQNGLSCPPFILDPLLPMLPL